MKRAAALGLGLLLASGAAAARAELRWEAVDHGVILRRGEAAGRCRLPGGRTAPGDCDHRSARDAWVFEHAGTYYLHYDAAGPLGWVAALATSRDLLRWEKRGPLLDLGAPGSRDAAAAAYATTFFDGAGWHLFYLGTPNAGPAPGLVPAFPYETLRARARGPAGPWEKVPGAPVLATVPGTYYSHTASPGPILRSDGEYRMFFSAAAQRGERIERTIAIARSASVGAEWRIDPAPILPPGEQIENASLFYEPSSSTWFLFANRVHPTGRYTSEIVVYWSPDLERWDPDRRAVVLDGEVSTWAYAAIGLPSVLPVGDRLAIVYDAAPGNGTGHLGRDIGLAWLDRPLRPPRADGTSRARPPLRWEMDSRDEVGDPQQLDLRFEDGLLRATVTAPSDDPHLYLEDSRVHATRYDLLRLRLRLHGAPRAPGAVYFFDAHGAQSLGFPLRDGWHTYAVDLTQSPRWAGRVERIRLDFPAGGSRRYEIELDWVELRESRPRR